jgi:hypothetical protein
MRPIEAQWESLVQAYSILPCFHRRFRVRNSDSRLLCAEYESEHLILRITCDVLFEEFGARWMERTTEQPIPDPLWAIAYFCPQFDPAFMAGAREADMVSWAVWKAEVCRRNVWVFERRDWLEDAGFRDAVKAAQQMAFAARHPLTPMACEEMLWKLGRQDGAVTPW